MNSRTMFRGLFAVNARSHLPVCHLSGGFSGFILLNLEALFIVMVGTSLMLWVSYPARDILRAVGTALSELACRRMNPCG